MTTTKNHSHTRRLRRGSMLFALLVVAGSLVAPRAVPAPSPAPAPKPHHAAARTHPHLPPLGPYSYTWPLKPFNKQHIVRGFLGDPRIGKTTAGMSHSFHFGIDIQGANRELVYANITGRVLIPANHSETVIVYGDNGVRFEFWHVKPYVRTGQHVVRNRTVLGHIYCWEHVHFSEWRDGHYVNPLRPGGLGPYRDRTRPYVKAFRVHATGHGQVDLTVQAYDPTPTPLPQPYTGNPVTPAELQWRIVGRSGAVTDWRTTQDFRESLPPNGDFSAVYAPATRQNWQKIEGRYVFMLARGFDTTQLRDGRYTVQVSASDTKGNTGVASFPLVVASV